MIAPVLYTNFGIPERFIGYTIGPLILIRPQYRYDMGLLAHERTHVRQFWRSFGAMPLLYLLSQRYRLRMEVEAYCVQLQYSPERERLFAGFIASKYRIPVSESEALRLLRRCE